MDEVGSYKALPAKLDQAKLGDLPNQAVTKLPTATPAYDVEISDPSTVISLPLKPEVRIPENFLLSFCSTSSFLRVRWWQLC